MKKRLDVLMFEREMVYSREKAQRLIMAGKVLVDGLRHDKSGTKFSEDIDIKILEDDKYVGRGAKKIEKAAQEFDIDFENKIVMDIGSSTGGFTDFALQHNAEKVYAVDVGTGQLEWKLRNDERVIVMEKTNFRNIEELPEEIDMFLVDVSFISVRKILIHLKDILKKPKDTNIVMLFKPQFEAGKNMADKYKGVIKDDNIHQKLLRDFRVWCGNNSFEILGEIESPIQGDKGNREFLFRLKIRYKK